MSGVEKAIAAALEPLVDDVVALEKRIDGLQLQKGEPGAPGDKGDKGDPGAPGTAGTAGADGVGITAPQWEAGAVYRKGAYVVANLGQHFLALRDTASSTDDRDHWQRVGSWGFRHRGVWDKDASYEDGDLFSRDFGTYCMQQGKILMLAGRGSIGKTGEPGQRGAAGQDGRDGATIVGAEAKGFTLVLMQRDGDGSLHELSADFGPAFRDVLKSALEAALPELAETLAELRADVNALSVRRRA